MKYLLLIALLACNRSASFKHSKPDTTYPGKVFVAFPDKIVKLDVVRAISFDTLGWVGDSLSQVKKWKRVIVFYIPVIVKDSTGKPLLGYGIPPQETVLNDEDAKWAVDSLNKWIKLNFPKK